MNIKLFPISFKIMYIALRLKELFVRNDENWYCHTQTEGLADVFAANWLNDDPPMFEDEENKLYSSAYILSHYFDLENRYIEQCDKEDETIRKLTNDLDECVNGMELYAFLAFDDLNYNFVENRKRAKQRKLPINCLYVPGYIVASLVQQVPFKDMAMYRIRIPVGNKVMYLGNADPYGAKHQIAIQKGAVLRIDSIDNHYINCTLVGTNIE